MTEEIKISKRAVFINQDQVVLPRTLTAENGAKALLMGEFFESREVPCPSCLEDEFGADCECGGTGYVTERIPVSWSTTKALYKKIVECMEVNL